MRPFLEHISPPDDSSWVLFDRRLDRIPFEWHYHPEYELTLTLNSRGQRFVGDNISSYDHGDLVLLGPKLPHTWCSQEGAGLGPQQQALVLWFSEHFVKGMIEPYVEFRPVSQLLAMSSRAVTFSEPVRALAQEAICRLPSQAPGRRLVSLLDLLLLLAGDRAAACLASSASQMVSLPSAMEDRFLKVLSYLHQHYREEISIAKLAKIASLSRSSLHRLFKQHANMTVSAYMMRLRLGNACALLMNSEKPIAVVANEVGYDNLANFNRQFKRLKDQTPRQFRAAFAHR